MSSDPFAAGPDAPPDAPPPPAVLADPRVQRVAEWANAWRRRPTPDPDDAARDRMFAWARDHGQIRECLEGLLASRSHHEQPCAADVELVDGIAADTITGPS